MNPVDVKNILFTLCLVLSEPSSGQWAAQASNTAERLRGVCAVNDTVVWASGNHGTFVRTTNGGRTWSSATVAGADSLDFRDVEAFDAQNAILLSIGFGANSRIYETSDGGTTWREGYEAEDQRIFLDEFAFWDRRDGIAVGDEFDGHLYLLRTADGGKTWDRIPSTNTPPSLPGEGAFAASGSGITVGGDSTVWIGTGVKAARVFRSTNRGESWQVYDTPLLHENESSGIFSIAFSDPNNGVAVGGDYRQESQARLTAARTTDGGRTWQLVTQSPPSGFRSAVAYLSKSFLLTVGPAGSDSSTDGGITWHAIGGDGYHAISSTPDGRNAWAVGEKGRIGHFRHSASK